MWKPTSPPLVLVLVSGIALMLRLISIGQQSAYMDEVSFILTGRLLIERRAVYAGALNWTYGSYLWPLIAGATDEIGGLLLVRTLTAVLGTLTAVATTLLAVRLVSEPWGDGSHAWSAGLAAGLIMAAFPTAIAIGRFGTYDALAGALFMLGIVTLLAAWGRRNAVLLAAAALLFAAFLAKYVVAIFFPFVCAALLLADRRRCGVRRSLGWFILPLAAACGVYFLLFRGELQTLLSFSFSYLDSFVRRLLARLARPDEAGRSGWRSVALVTAALVVALPGLLLTLDQAGRLVTFYPNLHPSLGAISEHTAAASTVLADDSALRYYLYPRLDVDRVTDPFFIDYRGEQGTPGYSAAISDRAFDVIVLDGGIGPIGRQIREELGWLVERYYEPVYTTPDRTGAVIAIYRPRRGEIVRYVGAGDYIVTSRDVYRRWDGEVAPATIAGLGGGAVYSFGDGPRGWGGQPEHEELQPGLQVSRSLEQTWNGQPTLQFVTSEDVTTVGVRGTGPVSLVRAQVFVDPGGAPAEVPVGMIGFDQDWRWRDDGFTQVLPVGRWTEVNWKVSEPGIFHQIGLKFPAGASIVYLGEVKIEP